MNARFVKVYRNATQALLPNARPEGVPMGETSSAAECERLIVRHNNVFLGLNISRINKIKYVGLSFHATNRTKPFIFLSNRLLKGELSAGKSDGQQLERDTNRTSTNQSKCGQKHGQSHNSLLGSPQQNIGKENL